MRHAVFGNRRQGGRNARFAEIFLRENVNGDLTPGRRNFDLVEGEDDRAVGIADFASDLVKGDIGVGRAAFLGVVAFDAHGSVSWL
jgi:hypothetical protein